MRRVAFALFALSACHATTPQDQVAEIASELCRCAEPGIRACADMLAQQLGPTVSDACASCVYERLDRCAAMVQDCPQLCVTPFGGGGGE